MMSSTTAEGGDRTAAAVVVVEDDETFRYSMARSLELAGYKVWTFRDAESACAQIPMLQPGVVLTDLRLPRADGLAVLKQVREQDPELPVLLMTGHGDIPTAIEAIRAGAYDFLEKPFPRERMLALVARASQQYRLAVENRLLRSQLAATSGIEQVVLGDSPAIRQLRDLILRLAPTPADVLVLGETGTGKELVARCLHDFGQRKGNFVAVNCAAIPENLFESELFGHESGAFTGATRQRIGKIEHANNGTLFLDELESMPLAAQAKVLRVLQERELERLGGNRLIRLNVRVVAATKVGLKELSERGEFRSDLFYRLNVASLRVPPLRERSSDVLILFHQFLQQASMRYQMPMRDLTAEEHQALLSSSWPGNVRELRACAERRILGLPIFVDREPTLRLRTFDESVALVERSLLEEALRRNEGSVKAACQELDISAATMYRKLKALNVDPAAYKTAGEDSIAASN